MLVPTNIYSSNTYDNITIRPDPYLPTLSVCFLAKEDLYRLILPEAESYRGYYTRLLMCLKVLTWLVIKLALPGGIECSISNIVSIR